VRTLAQAGSGVPDMDPLTRWENAFERADNTEDHDEYARLDQAWDVAIDALELEYAEGKHGVDASTNDLTEEALRRAIAALVVWP
jgi:hypothetical protein